MFTNTLGDFLYTLYDKNMSKVEREKIKKSNNIFDSEMKENVMRNEIS